MIKFSKSNSIINLVINKYMQLHGFKYRLQVKFQENTVLSQYKIK